MSAYFHIFSTYNGNKHRHRYSVLPSLSSSLKGHSSFAAVCILWCFSTPPHVPFHCSVCPHTRHRVTSRLHCSHLAYNNNTIVQASTVHSNDPISWRDHCYSALCLLSLLTHTYIHTYCTYIPALCRNQLLVKVAQENSFTKVSVYGLCVQKVISS